MTGNPRPRPAFGERPSVARPVDLVREPSAVLNGQVKEKGAKKHKKERKAAPLESEQGKEVALVLHLPKPVRKRLKAKAAEHGMSADEAAAHVVRMWVDG